MASPLVSVQTAGRRVGERWVWRGLNLDVAPGDRLAVRGPSGAGKTVLLRALAGLDALDEGELLSEGGPVRSLPRHRAEVAYAAQRPALFDGTVEDNLRAPFALAVRDGQRYDAERARALLARLGRPADLLGQSVDGLSGGEAQTVGLMRALLTDPTVLLLDEPTAGLDPERAEAVEAVIADALRANARRAAVWTSHDAAQLDRVTDRSLDL
ncbi:ABC transporter ATP-binding protein [Rubrivirga marina]|uniref:ABC transporter domain-containing protein n=1 Tax=Rubrivirga marina TaxID=1196024 RepID=A0A271IY00_9BACT|nr:ATP-binding cassette domain-containing protein [Rubrivirga marina]PAP75828.1 hypothetical protein BSZ37_04905 [Rubrivirga marina]